MTTQRPKLVQMKLKGKLNGELVISIHHVQPSTQTKTKIETGLFSVMLSGTFFVYFICTHRDWNRIPVMFVEIVDDGSCSCVRSSNSLDLNESPAYKMCKYTVWNAVKYLLEGFEARTKQIFIGSQN